MFVDIIKVFSSHGPSDAGRLRLAHKGPVATKLIRPQSTRLLCVGCDASSISQLQSKSKTIQR